MLRIAQTVIIPSYRLKGLYQGFFKKNDKKLEMVKTLFNTTIMSIMNHLTPVAIKKILHVFSE